MLSILNGRTKDNCTAEGEREGRTDGLGKMLYLQLWKNIFILTEGKDNTKLFELSRLTD